MHIYRNKKTGSMFASPCVCTGDDWEEVKSSKTAKTARKQKAAETESADGGDDFLMAAGEAYASTEDMTALWRSMTAEEMERAAALLPLVSDALRQQAANRGRDLDSMLESGVTLPPVAKAVTVGIVSRILRESTTGEPVSQQSVTAGPYTQQATYTIPGGGIINAIMNADLKALGLLRPTIGTIDPLRVRYRRDT